MYKRKETIGDATLYLGCCEEAMAEMTENQFDLAIVDPPYGIGEDGAKNHSRGKLAPPTMYADKGWDNKPPSVVYFDKLQSVSINQLIWGANHFIQNVQNANSSCWVVWDKLNGENDFADCELAWGSFNTAVRRFSYRWAGMLQGNMAKKETRIHPTQKPVNLYTWLLKNYAKEDDHILDTHGGSMSSVIACLDMGFKVTCYEIDEDYFDAGVKRVEEHVKQLRLF